jgi:serine/threonine protein kinase
MVEVVSSKGVEYLEADDDGDGDENNDSDRVAAPPSGTVPFSSNNAAAEDGTSNDDRNQQLNDTKPYKVLASSKHDNSNSKKKDKDVDPREGYKGNLYLVLEYVSHDLTGLMDVAYRFTEIQVKSIFKQLLEALQYMHDNKYVHRDIKSSNILIDHNFRVKLADFGLARCIEPAILDKLHEYVNPPPPPQLLLH